MPAFDGDYVGAFICRCLQCNSVYLIGITDRDSAVANICVLFENNYKCPGRLVALEHHQQNIDSFRSLLDLLESNLENEDE